MVLLLVSLSFLRGCIQLAGLLGAGLSWRWQRLPLSLIAPPQGGYIGFLHKTTMTVFQEHKTQCANMYQASACITLPLAKANPILAQSQHGRGLHKGMAMSMCGAGVGGAESDSGFIKVILVFLWIYLNKVLVLQLRDIWDRWPNINTEFYMRFNQNSPLTVVSFYIQICIF